MSLVCAALVVGHIQASGDPDLGLCDWVQSGAPMGLMKAIEYGGIFPRIEPSNMDKSSLHLIFTKSEPCSNYLSVEEAKELAGSEADRIVQLAFAEKFDSWADVLNIYGEVVVAKLGCIVKVRLDS